METGITIKFKTVCHSCINRKTYMSEKFTGIIYDVNGRIGGMITLIGCEHENVCKEYIESEDLK